MTTALFLLRCAEIGISMSDLDLLTVGTVIDLWSEKARDSQTFDLIGSQADMDLF